MHIKHADGLSASVRLLTSPSKRGRCGSAAHVGQVTLPRRPSGTRKPPRPHRYAAFSRDAFRLQGVGDAVGARIHLAIRHRPTVKCRHWRVGPIGRVRTHDGFNRVYRHSILPNFVVARFYRCHRPVPGAPASQAVAAEVNPGTGAAGVFDRAIIRRVRFAPSIRSDELRSNRLGSLKAICQRLR